METSSIASFGDRQRRLLTLLLEHKPGLNADELAESLDISRSAVHQHVTVLERDGYIEKLVRPSKGGRPSHAWRLTERGIHLFPKQYALFSDLMIQTLKKSLGSEGLTKVLRELGTDVAKDLAPRLQGKPVAEQIDTVAQILLELGYQASSRPEEGHELPLIEAKNCVYHHLAKAHTEVCQLDLALMSSLLDADIEHVECMVRGGTACRFRVHRSSKT